MGPNRFILIQENNVLHGLLGCASKVADLESVSRCLAEEIHIAVLRHQRLVSHCDEVAGILVLERNGYSSVIAGKQVCRLVSGFTEKDGRQYGLAVTVASAIVSSG